MVNMCEGRLFFCGIISDVCSKTGPNHGLTSVISVVAVFSDGFESLLSGDFREIPFEQVKRRTRKVHVCVCDCKQVLNKPNSWSNSANTLLRGPSCDACCIPSHPLKVIRPNWANGHNSEILMVNMQSGGRP